MKEGNIQKVHLTSKVLLTILMSFSAGMYIFSGEPTIFTDLGYPSYLMYPLAIAKILGMITIWSKYSELLTNWAYAGFFYDVILAFCAHLAVGDGEWAPSLIGIILVLSAVFTRMKK
ncbi:DoxX family protein [Ichthyenterobacterium sp. W332]|uniref:DoxX family protein n=1 Tax=Microcosmobacter mediterraneus TaxID=3075607 RepID=A0ABU2YN12_9FLAO|nr:DoxX family protein [Ichthyenterobacterium sp. W332]MDT0559553.1 DoxX family protein [Ichthyenterobacterium sp. W332]